MPIPQKFLHKWHGLTHVTDPTDLVVADKFPQQCGALEIRTLPGDANRAKVYARWNFCNGKKRLHKNCKCKNHPCRGNFWPNLILRSSSTALTGSHAGVDVTMQISGAPGERVLTVVMNNSNAAINGGQWQADEEN